MSTYQIETEGGTYEVEVADDTSDNSSASKSSPLSLGAVVGDIKETPSALWGAIKSIPTGVSNLAHAPWDLANLGADAVAQGLNATLGTNIPDQETNYKRLESTARGAGSLASGLAGSVLGSGAGPVGTIVGGAGGLEAFNKLNQLTGSDAPTSLSEDVANLRRNVVQGALTVGALKGAGTIAKGAGSLASRAEGGIQNELLGYKPTAKSKVAGAVDSSGNLVDDLTQAVKQVSQEDILVKNLKDSGYFNTLKATDSPATASLKLEQFNKASGQVLGDTVDAAAKLEAKILSAEDLAPWQKQQYLQENSPTFTESKAFLGKLNDLDPALSRKLNRKFDSITRAWEESNKTLEDFQTLKQDFGKINKKSFDKNASKAEQIEGQLDNTIYAEMADSIQKRIAALDPDLGAQFGKANKAYASSKAFEDSAFNASKKSISSKIIEDIFGISGKGAGLTAASAGAAFTNPLVASVLIPQRLAVVAKDIAPVATAKAAGSIGSLFSKSGRGISSAAVPLALGSNAANNDVVKNPEGASSPLGSAISSLFGATPAEAEIAPRKEPSDDEDMTKSRVPREALYKAVIAQESGGNPNAESNVGAQGLMQVMPATAKDIAKELGVKEYNLKDPETNKKFGQYYLDKLLNMFGGDEGLALTAYHSGPGKVRQLLKKSGGSTLEDILTVPFDKGGLGPTGRKYAKQTLARIKTDTALV